MALSKGAKTGIIVISSLVVLAIVSYVVWYFWNKSKQAHEEIQTGETNPDAGVKDPAKDWVKPYDDNTVFEWKSPIMKDKRVQWIQYRYNKYAKDRKTAGKTPDWPLLADDGAFGKNTHEAVARIMGVGNNKVSWNDFKAKVDYWESLLPASARSASTQFTGGASGAW
jgi:hypothetical protein